MRAPKPEGVCRAQQTPTGIRLVRATQHPIKPTVAQACGWPRHCCGLRFHFGGHSSRLGDQKLTFSLSKDRAFRAAPHLEASSAVFSRIEGGQIILWFEGRHGHRKRTPFPEMNISAIWSGSWPRGSQGNMVRLTFPDCPGTSIPKKRAGYEGMLRFMARSTQGRLIKGQGADGLQRRLIFFEGR